MKLDLKDVPFWVMSVRLDVAKLPASIETIATSILLLPFAGTVYGNEMDVAPANVCTREELGTESRIVGFVDVLDVVLAPNDPRLKRFPRAS